MRVELKELSIGAERMEGIFYLFDNENNQVGRQVIKATPEQLERVHELLSDIKAELQTKVIVINNEQVFSDDSQIHQED
jgi:hypothetical protein